MTMAGTYEPHPKRLQHILGWRIVESVRVVNMNAFEKKKKSDGEDATHVMASNSATLVTKSMSSALTKCTRMTNMAPM